MSSVRQPTIGITMGDPAGIGAEIILKTLADPALRQRGRFVIYGLNELLTYEADQQAIDPFWFRVQHDSPRTDRLISERTLVYDYHEFDGMIQAARRALKPGGLASKAFVESAIADAPRPRAHSRHIDAIVTAPICKASWNLAGFKWPGHTELLAHRTRAKRTAMMFVSPRLRVALATCHIPLMKIRDVLTIGRVFDPIDLGYEACRELGIEAPRIAVTGLNPHAGEDGLFGDEETRVIGPAIQMARNAGIDARGPFPADTVFVAAAAGKYDVVVAMYHDQGLTPVKLLDWDRAVNMTLGLPILRTSPDHGTAFDRAGRNQANAGSFRAAVELALDLTTSRAAAETKATEKSKAEPAA